MAFLLTPGPCMTSDAVRAAAASPDLNHREPEYLALIGEVRARLARLAGDGWQPYLLGGSGTAAMEAMATSCVERGQVLIVANGYYSERMDEIFRVHGIPHQTLRFGWMEPWDFAAIEAELARGGYEAVVGTHHETTTGRLNDVARLGELAHRLGARCLVDAMSSFGGDPLEFTHLDAVCASANKCLHGLPGVSFVLATPDLAGAMASFPRRTYYLSLPMYAGEDPPLTPPVPMLQAFRQALRELPEGGQTDLYRERATELRSGLERLGMACPIPVDDASCTLVMAEVPRGWSADAWFAANLRAGWVLYRCKGELRDRFFQVSTMGAWPAGVLSRWLEDATHILATR